MDKNNFEMALFVGTSGFSYKHWLNGVFYPKGLPQSRLLEYYATRFNTVEINSTFYRMPSEKTLRSWFAKTPDDFIFSVKMGRTVTHYAKLKECKEELKKQRKIAEILKEKLGVILIQLPPSLGFNAELMDGFLAELKDVWGSLSVRVAVEFRNKSWFVKETFALLDKHGATICVSDFKGATNTETNDATFVYIRRHGPSGRYYGSYTEEELQKDALMIKGFLAEGKDVFVYFNNDLEGYAPSNAELLKEMLKH